MSPLTQGRDGLQDRQAVLSIAAEVVDLTLLRRRGELEDQRGDVGGIGLIPDLFAAEANHPVPLSAHRAPDSRAKSFAATSSIRVPPALTPKSSYGIAAARS
jgi:hypothetical protein